VEQNTPTLDYWIGERVSVRFVTEDENTAFEWYDSCTLQSADEQGVLLRFSHAEISRDRYSFFPPGQDRVYRGRRPTGRVERWWRRVFGG